MEVAVLVGIQGSGKTTFAHRHLGGSHVRLSRDVLKSTHRESVLQHACLAIGQSFVVDNTNPGIKNRAPIVAAAKAAGFRIVAYYFPPDVHAALDRNASRSGTARVPDVAIHGTAAKLEPPTFSEGFDSVYRVTNDGDAFKVEEMSDAR